MASIQADVVIIGGGPAGSTIGYILSRMGYECLLVEKKKFPRDKLCGGVFTPKAVDTFCGIYGLRKDDSSYYSNSVDRLSFYHRECLIASFDAATSYRIVDRSHFDHFLIKKFQDANGTVLENTTVLSVDTENRVLKLSDNTIVTYKFLVGADGATSSLRRTLGILYRPDLFCLEAKVSPELVQYGPGISLFFGVIEIGYSWIIPNGERCSIGLGGPTTKNDRTYNEVFARFLRQVAPDAQARARGVFLSSGAYVKKPFFGESVLFIGDAAGLVDPITGEGLYFAIKSAEAAAGAINASLKEDKDAVASYMGAIKPIHKIMNDGRCAQKFVFKKALHKRFFRPTKGTANFLRHFNDKHAMTYEIGIRGLLKGYLTRNSLYDDQ